MKINVDVNVEKNSLIKEGVIKDLFGILVIMHVNRKSCDVGQYLDYKNSKCRKKIIGELIKECRENIDENEMICNETLIAITLNDYKKVCSSCTIYIVLFVIFLVTSTIISSVFIHFH